MQFLTAERTLFCAVEQSETSKKVRPRLVLLKIAAIKTVRYNYFAWVTMKKRALISCYKKEGIVEFVKELVNKFNFEII